MKKTQNLTVWFTRDQMQMIRDYAKENGARGMASVVRFGTLRTLGKKPRLEKPLVIDMGKPMLCHRHGITMDFGQYLNGKVMRKRCQICMRATSKARRDLAREVKTSNLPAPQPSDMLRASSALAWNS